MKLTKKSTVIESMLSALAPYGRSGNVCAVCGSDKMTDDDFRDDPSREEAAISCMCQDCIDAVFGTGE